MKYQIRSYLSIGIGAAAAICALVVLLQDAIRTNVWTIEHGLIPGMVVIAIGTGHLAGSAMKARRYGSALGFAASFLLATTLTLYTSVSKQADVAATRASSAHVVNDARAEKEAAMATLKAQHGDAVANITREMTGSTCGPRCRSWKERALELEGKIILTEADLFRMAPTVPIAAGATKVATVLAMVFGIDAAHSQELLQLVEPFARAWLFELTSIVALGFAFGSTISMENPKIPTLAVEKVNVSKKKTNRPKVVPPPKGGLTKELAEQDLVTLLALGKPVESQDVLAQRWNVPKPTVSRWLKDFEDRGMITREAKGRSKQIVAA